MHVIVMLVLLLLLGKREAHKENEDSTQWERVYGFAL